MSALDSATHRVVCVGEILTISSSWIPLVGLASRSLRARRDSCHVSVVQNRARLGRAPHQTRRHVGNVVLADHHRHRHEACRAECSDGGSCPSQPVHRVATGVGRSAGEPRRERKRHRRYHSREHGLLHAQQRLAHDQPNLSL